MAEFLNDNIDFTAYLKETDAKTKVLPASAWTEDLKARLRAKAGEKRVYLPWTKANSKFEFRRGEVTLWAGQNGHGKSLMTTQVALSLMGQDERVCIASFEMKPLTTIQRAARMYAGTNPFSPEYQTAEGFSSLDALYEEFGEWSDGRLWLYDQTGTAEPDLLIGMVRYCATQKGINHIFIDNLAKVISAEDDYNGQKIFVDQLTAVARDHGVHIHIIHHLKKPTKETDSPDKHDIKGSGAITDLVDNVMLVWRNKKKEELFKKSQPVESQEADQFLICVKQRNYEGSVDDEPKLALYFLRDANQYVASFGDRPQCFINFPHVASPVAYTSGEATWP